MFKVGTKFEKYTPFYDSPLLKGAYFISSGKSALVRKSMQAPLFSKEAVRSSEHLITDMVAKFLDVLSGYASRASPLDLSTGFTCLAADVSMNYGFQKPLNALYAENFESEIIKSNEMFLKYFFWTIYFRKFVEAFYWVTMYLPRWFMGRFMKPLVLVKSCLGVSAARANETNLSVL